MADTRLPKRPLRDATHTSRLRNTYYKQIMILFQGFSAALMPGLERLLKRNIQQSYSGILSTQWDTFKPGFIREFTNKIDDVSNATIYIGMDKTIRPNITTAYKRGKKKAADNPRLQPYSIIIPYELNLLDKSVVEDLIARNSSNVTKLTEDMKTELTRTMTEGIQQQLSTQDILRNIKQMIPDCTTARAKMIARTEISYSYNNAQAKAYQSVGIEQWQWLAALGYHCCDECIANHGQIFEWDDQWPPLHPNCMCGMYPIVDKGFKP